MFVHGGPFANIAHGCNSILATKMALKLSDYVVTEAGFGADLGAEKFLDIKCREAGLNPKLVVMVATIKALKYHGGMSLKNLKEENVEALAKGIKNLEKHVDTVKKFGIKCVIAINKFHTDSDAEIEFIQNWSKEHNIPVSLSEVFAKGGEGGIDLANKVIENISEEVNYEPLYDLNDSIYDKIFKIASKAYGANEVVYADSVKEEIEKLQNSDKKDYYICMAKCPNSLTDNPKIIGAPKDFAITIRDIRVSTGAKFIICLTGEVMTMPGLSKEPMALKIDIDENYNVFGLM
jgi:formate--tetrahydrofolate ligase